MTSRGSQIFDSLLIRQSAMAERVRNFDWTSTSLGNPETWPESLRAALGICMNSHFPMFIWWGPELINIYNDAYSVFLGQRHPAALGCSAPEIWGEIWPILTPQIEAVLEHGEATWNERVYLKLERNGFQEDTWFTWSYSPIPDDQGGIGGLFCACKEETQHVHAEVERDRFAEHQRLALDSARLGWWRLDPESGIIIGDHRFMAICGATAERLSYVEGMALVHPEDQERVILSAEAALRPDDPVPFSIEYRVVRPDGSLRWVYASGQTYYAGEGAERRYTSFVGTIEDITERKFVESTLRSERKVLELIATDRPLPEVLETLLLGIEERSLDGMLCAISLVDSSGKRLFCGAAPNLPQNFIQALEGESIDSRFSPCSAAIVNKQMLILEDLHGQPDWEDFQVLAGPYGLRACSSTPIFNTDKEPLATLTIYYPEPHLPTLRDFELIQSAVYFTSIAIERKRAEKQVRDALEAEKIARADAEHVNLMKDEFLTTLSHELRTPLNAMLGWSQMLRGQNLNPEVASQALDTIERNARAQKQLVEDLLDMGRIISGKVRLDLERIELQEVVDSAIDSIQPTATAKGVQLEKRFEPYAVLVNGDVARLQQVFWNLLSNAVKFTPRGGQVQVELQCVNPNVEIAISDTGIGIPQEFLPHMFDRFTQADGAITRRHGGLGLGLSIVKHLVEMHSGTVSATSLGDDLGTTFIISLPLAVLPVDNEICPLYPGVPDSPALNLSANPGMSGLKVLVLDDEADARALVAFLLESRGAIVRTAGNALEALQFLQTEPPDVIVSDIGMPEVDGYEFIRRVRALEQVQGGFIPAIALTAFARSEDRQRALQSGFQSYVSKPMEAAELIAVVASVCGRTV